MALLPPAATPSLESTTPRPGLRPLPIRRRPLRRLDHAGRRCGGSARAIRKYDLRRSGCRKAKARSSSIAPMAASSRTIGDFRTRSRSTVRLTVSPGSALAGGDYYVTVTAGAFEDLALDRRDCSARTSRDGVAAPALSELVRGQGRRPDEMDGDTAEAGTRSTTRRPAVEFGAGRCMTSRAGPRPKATRAAGFTTKGQGVSRCTSTPMTT